RPLHTPDALYFFSFSHPPHPRDPHSFPTRRSSDLLQCGRGPRPLSTSHALGLGLKAVTRCAVRASALVMLDAAVAQRDRASAALDRKSTRLNSSHDQISYAVFCLKKKKKY